MSDKINDGGPAFPHNMPPDHSFGDTGMTIRDWFAVTFDLGETRFATLQDMARFVGVSVPDRNDMVAVTQLSMVAIARLKYMAADAMIAERERSR